ncbi:MAG: NAD(P)/FAD-dependent oxidoreductase [Desulfurococcales archaeon]|nr:NAD(P)/FAD-dependent oxidoreductase [Desulfurococcales archaeon]
METLKLAVVGGGFAGLYAAYRLSETHEVTLYEEDDIVGRPKHCTGLVSRWTMEKIGPPALNSLENSFNKITFIAESSRVEFERDSIAVKLDRIGLEQRLLNEAKKNGVTVRMPYRVSSVTPKGEVLSFNGTKHQFDAVIVADGLAGMVSSSLGINKYNYRRILGVNIDVKLNHGMNTDEFKIIFSDIFKGFFGWIVPTSPDKLIVGGGSIGLVRIQDIISGINIHGEIRDRYGGIILTGPPARKPYRGLAFVIGDAAGLTKPFTGGGLYPSVKVVDCFSSKSLDYWQRCLDGIVRELRSQLHIARIFQEDLSPGSIADLFDVAKKHGISEILSHKLDYDRHEELVSLAFSRKVETLKAGVEYLFKHPVSGLSLLRRMLFVLVT